MNGTDMPGDAARDKAPPQNDTRITEYHSAEWERLVDGGWTTEQVWTLPDGTQVARMRPGR